MKVKRKLANKAKAGRTRGKTVTQLAATSTRASRDPMASDSLWLRCFPISTLISTIRDRQVRWAADAPHADGRKFSTPMRPASTGACTEYPPRFGDCDPR